MKTLTFNVYQIGEHPDKEKCFNWIRDNWYDLNEFSLDELIASIKALSSVIGGSVKYSMGLFPDIGEHISFIDYDEDILNSLSTEDCVLTGVWWDNEVIEGLKNDNISKVLKKLHDETEYRYSDESLEEFCNANEYHFYESGKFANV